MREIYPYNNPDNWVSGYTEIWNLEQTHYPNKVSKETLDDAVGYVNFDGVLISKDFKYIPYVAPTNSKAYLFDGVVIIHSILKKPENFTNIPLETLTMIAKTKEQITWVAKKLKLPLEELVSA